MRYKELTFSTIVDFPRIVTRAVFVLAFCWVMCSPASASIRRVGFFGQPLPGIDYATFVLAQNAANAGDTVVMYPGAILSGNIDKRLVIIGPGTWLDPNTTPKGNANLQAFGGTVTSQQIAFRTGSTGSTIMGFDFGGSSIYVGVNDITIRRNMFVSVNLSYNPNPSTTTSTPITINNLQMLENYRLNVNSSYSNGFTLTNLNISNNLMHAFIISMGNSYGGSITNNTWSYDNTLTAALNGGSTTQSLAIGQDFGGGTFLFQNNLLVSYTNANPLSNIDYFTFANSSNIVFNYNVILQASNFSSWGPSGTGNVITPTANAGSIFQGFPGIGSRTGDDRYMLAAGSPGLVVNRPGSTIDAGMYGGLSPYKLSTIPSIPTIYQLNSPQGNNPSGSTIQINLSTRGNN